MAEKQRILSHPRQNDLHPFAHHYACTGFTPGYFLVHSDDQSHSTSYKKDCLSEKSKAALLLFCFPLTSSLFCSSAFSPAVTVYFFMPLSFLSLAVASYHYFHGLNSFHSFVFLHILVSSSLLVLIFINF